ncbi:HAD family hydrolase [Vagococcus zengguangii]|uniref:HAD family phosphatase n=1 Tax=Vagococcus zengguangii TaxID=2571750 RepID=A0A4D7CSS9_9ENTE|nr:HAD family phosphatase [Vagococcus zengguangii]QCI85560.1 HAD family phosphatase [Vagococcus zengguangii]TLG79413.1 HAD family phosphatase [Vagococcus zengguangii]
MYDKSLIIFDMDGLIFDTGRLAYASYLDAAKKFDFELKPEVYYYLTGRTEEDIRIEMKNIYNRSDEVELWRDYINQTKEEILLKEKRVYKKRGLIELLSYLKNNNYLIALASSASRQKIDYYFELEELSQQLFDTIVSGDDVVKGKPEPEIFLKACEILDVSPGNAIVLEDSTEGLKAANRAGIFSVYIEDNLDDLPSHEGKYRLNQSVMNLEHLEKKIYDLELPSLLELIDYLNQKVSM